MIFGVINFFLLFIFSVSATLKVYNIIIAHQNIKSSLDVHAMLFILQLGAKTVL